MKQATTEIFGFEIVDEEMVQKIEDQMYETFEVAAKSMNSKKGEKEMLISVILSLLDLSLTNIIIMNLQNKFIEDYIDGNGGPNVQD
jgi:hypothetical protein